MTWQPDIIWWKENWSYVMLALVLANNFLGNLLTNCPFLKANKTFELIQGVFNAAVQTLTRQKLPDTTETHPNP